VVTTDRKMLSFLLLSMDGWWRGVVAGRGGGGRGRWRGGVAGTESWAGGSRLSAQGLAGRGVEEVQAGHVDDERDPGARVR
jgi:hypothetical protein